VLSITRPIVGLLRPEPSDVRGGTWTTVEVTVYSAGP
jgi:hypothetical protein